MRTPSQEPSRDAIIFIAGLEPFLPVRLYDPNVLAQRFAAELDRNTAGQPGQFYAAPPGRDESYLDLTQRTGRVGKSTVNRHVVGGDCPVIDLYVLDCNPVLRAAFQRQGVFVQAARLFLAILSNVPRVGRLIRHRAASLDHKLQLAYCLLILMLFVAYLFILILAAVQAIMAVLEATPFANNLTGIRLTVPQFIVVLMAVVQALLPNLRRGITTAAVDALAAINYVTLGENRDVVSGQFADLLDDLAARGLYRRVDVIGYSFGCLVALDNLFPSGSPPIPRTDIVQSLVTIGCPYDLVQIIVPGYFAERRLLPGKPGRWINVYCPVDVLASNFHAGHKQGEASKAIDLDGAHAPPDTAAPLPEDIEYGLGISKKHLNIFDWLTLVGLRAHWAYWQDQPEVELSCFHQIVAALYQNDPLLA